MSEDLNKTLATEFDEFAMPINDDEISVDMLLDKEKSDIEQAIIDKFKTEEKPEVIEENSKNDLMKRKKDELIADINELEKALCLPVTPEGKLNRCTKVKLTKILAELMNKTLEPTPTPEISNSNTLEGESEEKMQRTVAMTNLITENMFTMHSMLLGALESGSVHFKHKTGDIALLQGLSEANMKRKQELLAILKQMYLKYKNEIDQYVSPVTLYFSAVTSMCVETATSNVSQKKKSLNQESQK